MSDEENKPAGRARTGNAIGGAIAGSGCLIAIAPLILTPAYCALRGNPGGCGDVAMTVFLTFPLGGIIMVIGLIAAMVSASTRTVTDEEPDDSDSPTQETQPDSATNAAYPRDEVPRQLRRSPSKIQVSPGVARSLWILNIVAFALVFASTIFNIIDSLRVYRDWNRTEQLVDWPSITMFFTVTPLFIVAWLLWLAHKLRTSVGTPDVGTRFIRLESVQNLVGGASGVCFIVALLLVPGWSEGPFGAWSAISGITPVAVGIIAWLVTIYIRIRLYERADAATKEPPQNDGD